MGNLQNFKTRLKKLNRNLFKNLRRTARDGFTLVEVMVASAIGLIVIVGFMQIMAFQTRGAKTGSLNRQVDDIKRQFQTWVYNKNYCDQTFRGMRNGDPPMNHIYRNKDTLSKIISVGDRIPASDFTIESMRLLSTAEINAKFPLATGNFRAVSPDGIGTSVLYVKIRQLRGSSGTTQIQDGQDGGAFGGVTHDLYFPIQAYFNVIVKTTIKTISNSVTPIQLSSSTSAANGGLCCLDCPGPNGTGTLQQYITTESGGIAPTSVSGNNPAFFSSDADDTQTYTQTTMLTTDGMYEWKAECTVANQNMRIMDCVNTGSNAL